MVKLVVKEIVMEATIQQPLLLFAMNVLMDIIVWKGYVKLVKLVLLDVKNVPI